MNQINILGGTLARFRDFNSAIALKWKIVAALLLATIMIVPSQQASALLLKFGCNSDWTVEGSWGDGTVMESRTCVVHDTAQHKAIVESEWRTRRGGTSIQSDWDLTATTAYIQKYTPNNDIVGHRSNYGDAFNVSYIVIRNYYACSPQTSAINNEYQGWVRDVSANPNGTTNGESAKKDGNSSRINNNYIEC